MKVPVVSKDGRPLMPTNPAKARRMIKDGVAVGKFSKLGMFYVQMKIPVSENTQDVSLAVDPGSKYDGYAVGGPSEIILKAMASMPTKIAKRLKQRRELRRFRRRRKTWRRPERLNNRKRSAGWIAPSQLAKVQLRLKIIHELSKVFPLKVIVVEDVAARHHSKGSGKYFSTVEIGKTKLYEEIKKIAKLVKCKGWQTAEARKKYNIPKSKKKSKICPESHANDAVAMLCFLYGKGINNPAPFWYWRRPEFVRRSLYRMNFQKGGRRSAYGGTSFGVFFRKGDYVQIDTPSGKKKGWIVGYYRKKGLLGVGDIFGNRLGYFEEERIELLMRRTGVFWRLEV